VTEPTLTLARQNSDLLGRPRLSRQPATREADIPSRLQRFAAARVVQPRLLVGPADDPFEREAEQTARAVSVLEPLPLGLGAPPIPTRLMRTVQRAVGKGEPVTKPVRHKDDDRKARMFPTGTSGPEVAPLGLETSVRSLSHGGEPLPDSVRTMFEPRFGYDFSDVRIHTDREAAGAATGLGARAFTVGDHIFFGSGQYQPASATGRHLIAHELTHTIQQKPGTARAHHLLAAPARAQRFLDSVRNAIAEKIRNWVAKDFPPWDLITLIIGWDPIRGVAVKGSTKDWIHAAMKLAPDGEALYEKLDKEGQVDAIVGWWDAEVAKLDLTFAKIKALVDQGWERLSAGDAFDPLGAWEKKLKPLYAPVVARVWNFIKAVGARVLQVVRDLVMKPLAEWARQQKGYTLLTIVLGRDPVTGAEVKPTLKGVIFAVLDLVPGGEQIKDNLEKSKTVEKAAAWFKTEVGKLQLSWEGIKTLFRQAWDALKAVDLLNLKVLAEKVWAIFGPTVLRILDFVVAVGKKVLEFIFEGAMLLAGPIGLRIVSIVRKIGDAFGLIVADPIRFLGHLLDGVKKGVKQFGVNIWGHLKTGLLEWLMGTLADAGLALPKVWDLHGLLDLALQILGITWAKIRAKIVAVIGDKTMAMLEKTFTFVVALVTEGPAAAWREITTAIGNFWDMIIGGIKDWAVTRIVTNAITQLATMFNPAGAVIQAILAIYNTVAFFIERINQILTFVEAVVDSIANIAIGKIDAAANYIEKAMAKSIPVLLGFLARLIRLGDVSAAIKKVIAGFQEKVDKAIDSLIKWIVDKAKSLLGIGGEKKPGIAIPDGQAAKTFSMAGEDHTVAARVVGGRAQVTMASDIARDLEAMAKEALDELDDPKLKPQINISDTNRPAFRLLLLELREKAKPEDINREYDLAGKPPGVDQWLTRYIATLIEERLVPIAKLGVPSLQKLLIQVPDVRFLPFEFRDGNWIRDNLYVPSAEWKAIKEQDDPAERKRIADQVDEANRSRDFNAWRQLQIAPDGYSGYLIPSTAEMGKYRRSAVFTEQMGRDHVEPLAKHWTEAGYRQGDSERGDVAKGKGGWKLELVTREYNSRKGSLSFKYRPDVDADFSSLRCDSPKKSWKIKGLPFLRAPNGPSLTQKAGA
jgi:hypothetical protein